MTHLGSFAQVRIFYLSKISDMNTRTDMGAFPQVAERTNIYPIFYFRLFNH